MQALIDGILHYSRMANSTVAKEEVNVKELIISIIDLINPPSHIKFEVADNMPTFVAEKIKLHEVFQNLISNSIKYNDKEAGLVQVSYHDYPDHFQFIVKDNGCGIRAEHFNIVFAIFQTLTSKDKNESTGIGLTIVKKIVENQGGVVTLESEFGVGTTFRFTWNK
jgi:light-regulated signal transduction histidine kinase (bacteriophytochrome)